MDDQLAKKIIREVQKSSDLECAIVDDLGQIYAQTKNFAAEKNKKVEIPSKLLHDNEQNRKIYISFEKSQEVTPALTKLVGSIASVVITQYYDLQSLSAVHQRADHLTYDYLVTGLISGQEFFAIAEGGGYRKNMNLTVILLEISDPNYLLLNKREVKEGERDEIIERARKNIEDTFHHFYTKYPLSKVAYLGGQRFLVWKDMGPHAAEYLPDFKKTLPTLHFDIQEALRTKISMGVGKPKKGPKNMKESYLEADTAIKFGKQNWGENQVYSYDDFGAIAPMYNGAIENNLNFKDEVIEKVKEHDGLMRTLEEFVDNELSLTKTAKRLKIHRNTLVYRLDKIFELTGLDPKVFNDAFELKIALIMEKNRVH